MAAAKAPHALVWLGIEMEKRVRMDVLADETAQHA